MNAESVDRIYRHARWSMRMAAMRTNDLARWAVTERVIMQMGIGDCVDATTGRAFGLEEQDTPVTLEPAEERKVLVYRWTTHPERPHIIGRWIYWIFWLVSPSHRAFCRGTGDGYASVERNSNHEKV